MKKLKIRIDKIRKFLREIAVVVIGVAITLSTSYWITNKNAKRDMTLSLSMIKLELEENIRIIEEAKNSHIQVAINYSDYLNSHKNESLDLDTLLFYRDRTTFNSTIVLVKRNAFEMFKTSGNMSLVKDKKLLLSIWDVYTKLDELENISKAVIQLKMEEMRKYFYLNSLPDEELLKNPPMYDFYVNMYGPLVQVRAADYTLAILNETKSMLE